jgi:hypothetical protein
MGTKAGKVRTHWVITIGEGRTVEITANDGRSISVIVKAPEHIRFLPPAKCSQADESPCRTGD